MRLQGMGVDYGGDGIGGVVEAIYKFKSKSNQQGDAEQNVRSEGGLEFRTTEFEDATHVPVEIFNDILIANVQDPAGKHRT